MVDYVAILEKNPAGVFSTLDNGQIKSRMFQYLLTKGNKVYFCTSNEKPVYKQLTENGVANFCVHSSDCSEVLSINGKVTFVDDVELKTQVLDNNPMIKNIYKDATNPVFEAFYIDVEEVETFSYTEGPRKFTI